MKIVKLEGEDLRRVVAMMGNVPPEAYSLRVAIDVDGFKFKVNEWTWTPGYGQVEK